MANRVAALRQLRDLIIQIALIWVLIAFGIQQLDIVLPLGTIARIVVIMCTAASILLLFFEEIILRFVPPK